MTDSGSDVRCQHPPWEQERGISSYRLEKMGFSRATYYAIRNGQSVSTNTIDRLCHLLQCRVEDVMEHIETADNE